MRGTTTKRHAQNNSAKRKSGVKIQLSVRRWCWRCVRCGGSGRFAPLRAGREESGARAEARWRKRESRVKDGRERFGINDLTDMKGCDKKRAPRAFRRIHGWSGEKVHRVSHM